MYFLSFLLFEVSEAERAQLRQHVYGLCFNSHPEGLFLPKFFAIFSHDLDQYPQLLPPPTPQPSHHYFRPPYFRFPLFYPPPQANFFRSLPASN